MKKQELAGRTSEPRLSLLAEQEPHGSPGGRRKLVLSRDWVLQWWSVGNMGHIVRKEGGQELMGVTRAGRHQH